VTITYHAPEGLAGVADRKTQVVIDTRLNDELLAEGMAREVVRRIQDLRKDASLDLSDRIELSLQTDSEVLRRAIDAHRGYIGAETQADRWAERPLNGAATKQVDVDGHRLTIGLRRIEAGARG